MSTAAGLCTLNVNANRKYTIAQVGAPGGWFASPTLAAGRGVAVVSRAYNSLSVAVGTANVTIPVAASQQRHVTDRPQRHLGALDG